MIYISGRILNVIIFSVSFNLNAVLKWYNRGSLGGKTLHRYHYLYTTLVLQTQQWDFMGVQDGLKMWCAWPDSCCLSEAAGYVGGVKSSHQVCRKSGKATKTEDITSNMQGLNVSSFSFCLSFFHFFRKALFSPLHSSFLLFQGHILGAPPGSEWECCRPFSRRAQRGCKAAGCSGLNCTEWEKRRPARKNKYKNIGNLDQFQRMTRKFKNILRKLKCDVFFNLKKNGPGKTSSVV